MTKKELARICIERLKKEYLRSECTLDYDHAWQLLVSVRLAAQCTDARVNVVVQNLFAKYPNVEALAAAEPEEIEAIVSPAGWGAARHGIFLPACVSCGMSTAAKSPMTLTRCWPCPVWGAKAPT